MGLKKRHVASVLALVVAAAALLGVVAVHFVRSRDVVSLMSCMESASRPVAAVCRRGLYAFHPTADEVRALNEAAGASWLVQYGNKAEAASLLRHFVDHGLDVNAVHRTGMSALHIAASDGDVEAVCLLLAFGANAIGKDAAGRSPLELAAFLQTRTVSSGRQDAMRVLGAAVHERSALCPA